MSKRGTKRRRAAGSQYRNRKKRPCFRVVNITMRDLVGCVVIVGFLVVFAVTALRLPPEHLLELLQLVLNLLSIVFVALFGDRHGGDQDQSKE